MTERPRVAVELRGAARVVVGLFGVVLLLLPVAAYVDGRTGILGPLAPSSGFDLFFAVLAVFGAVLALSAMLGRWLMWKDVQVLDESAPDTPEIETTRPVDSDDEHVQEPPYDGQYKGPVAVDDADSRFVAAAATFYARKYGDETPFEQATKRIYKSWPGRPSWYFYVEVPGGKYVWIRVPHAGRRGDGAGDARSIE